MAQRFYAPIPREFTNAGAVGVGFKWYFYTTGTSTPITTYSNVGLSSANTNPVVADANGRFAEIFVSDFSLVKAVLKDADGNTISTIDPVNPSGASTVTLNDLGVRPTSYWGVTAGTTSAYTLVANPTITAYSNNQTFIFQANAANAAAPTLAIDGLPALNLKKYTGQGTKIALQAGDMQATERYLAINDGVDIVILNPRNSVIYAGTPAALTIATGVITITNGGSVYTIDTEASAATDDLDTINGGVDGEIAIFSMANASRFPTIKHLTGNISLVTARDFTLSALNQSITLKYSGSASLWYEQARTPAAGSIVQKQSSLLTTTDSTSVAIPFDDTIPQITEGKEYTTIAFTPKSASSMLEIEVLMYLGSVAGSQVAAALFVDATASAIAVGYGFCVNNTNMVVVAIKYEIASGSTATRTYRLRYGTDGGVNTVVNGTDAAGRKYGGVLRSGLTIREIV